MMARNMVEIHKRTINKLKEIAEKDKFGIVDLQELAKSIGSDIRTVKKHLAMAEIDGIGEFNSDQTIFIIKIK